MRFCAALLSGILSSIKGRSRMSEAIKVAEGLINPGVIMELAE